MSSRIAPVTRASQHPLHGLADTLPSWSRVGSYASPLRRVLPPSVVADHRVKHPGLASTRLVAVTGYVLPDDIEKAREAGFDRHLAKPVDPAAIVGF